MTKLFLIYGIAGTLLMHTPANAIIKCFKNAPYQVDDAYLTSANSYFGLVMGDTTVEGVALCGESASSLGNGSNATKCQCIATTPFISEWMYPDISFDTQAECEEQCANYCTQTYWQDREEAPVPEATWTNHSQCPSGFLAVSYDNLTLANSSCPSGAASIGTITACDDIGTDDQECGLFMPAGTYTDQTGTYEYSEPCPWTD